MEKQKQTNKQKHIALTRQTFISEVMSLIFNTLSNVSYLSFQGTIIVISRLQSPPTVVMMPKKIKSIPVSIVCPFMHHKVMGPDAMIVIFWMLNFKRTLSLSTFNFIKRLFVSLLSAVRVVSSAYRRLLIFLPAILIQLHPTWHFCMMQSAYVKQAGLHYKALMQSFPNLNQLMFYVPVLTAAFWPAYRFVKRQLRWSGIHVSLRIFHSIVWSTQSKALA